MSENTACGIHLSFSSGCKKKVESNIYVVHGVEIKVNHNSTSNQDCLFKLQKSVTAKLNSRMVKRQRTIPMPSAAKYARLITAPKAFAAAQLRKLTRDVKRLKSGVETKYYNGGMTALPGNTTADPQIEVFNIIPGTSANQRLGNRILITRLQFGGTYTDTGGTTGNVCKFVLCVDKQCNGALPAAADAPYTTFQASMSGALQPEFTGRYRVLVEKTIVATADKISVPFRVDLKNLQIPIVFDAAAPAIASLAGHNIVLFTYANGVPTTGFDAQTRISYQDE